MPCGLGKEFFGGGYEIVFRLDDNGITAAAEEKWADKTLKVRNFVPIFFSIKFAM